MQKIIARKKEKKVLDDAFNSPRAEFIAVYGRRRVGKTYLVKNTFSEKNECIFFYVTGKKDGKRQEQINHFVRQIGQAFYEREVSLAVPTTWEAAFLLLDSEIKASPKKKIVLFFDEFPWMVTRKSGLLESLTLSWNHDWVWDSRIKLIVCGSAASWILKQIVQSTGGLYNRTTERIHVKPFSLQQTKEYFQYLGVTLSNRMITDLYMILGGIPHYLNQVKPGLSAVQVVEELGFGRDSFLMTEFKALYETLFTSGQRHAEIARVIANHPKGIGQEELVKELGTISSGTGLLSRLEDLVDAGFVEKHRSYKYLTKGVFYKMADEYSIFYFRWIEPHKNTLAEKGMSDGYWERLQSTPAWRSWAGFAFECICFRHIPLIRNALKLSPAALPYNWRYVPQKGTEAQGAQIDLLFDREDNTITICEIKYTIHPFVIDKAYAQNISTKIDVFENRTKTKKDLFFALISAHGLKENEYSKELLSGVVTLDDFFSSVD